MRTKNSVAYSSRGAVYHPGMKPSILMAPEDDSGGGGGGGGGSGGDDDEDRRFTERFNRLFHKASAERDRRLEKKMTELFQSSLATSMGELKELLSDSGEDDINVDDDIIADRGKGKLPPAVEAMLAQTRKEAKEAREIAEKYRKEAEEEKQRNIRNEELAMLRSELTGKVKPALLDMTVDQLHRNMVRDPDTGAYLFKNGEETLPFKEGVVAWAKSDVGKELAPPREAGGSGGGRPGGDASIQKGPLTMEGLGALVSNSLGGGR